MKPVRLSKVRSEREILEVASLAHTIWREHYTPLLGSDQVEYMLETIQSPGPVAAQIADGYDYYLIRRAGGSVGYAAVKLNDPAPDMFLSKLYLLRDERGRGFAKTVLEELDDIARKAAQKEIWLTVNRGNSSVEKYERLGFRIREERVTDIGHGYVMDDYIMFRAVPELSAK